MIRCLGVLLLLGAAGAPCVAPAQTPLPEPGVFDTSTSSLEPGAFTPIEALIHRFGQAPKGEFETTADYRARLANAPPPSGWFAIPAAFLLARYDADKGKLTVFPLELGLSIGAIKRGLDVCAVTAKVEEKPLGSYEMFDAQSPDHVEVAGDRDLLHRLIAAAPRPLDAAAV